MVCLHGKHRLGDPHSYREEDHTNWEDLKSHILRDHPGSVVLPLYLMDHSVLSIDTTDAGFRAWDPERWDWGQVGLIFASAEAIRADFGVQRISAKLRAKVEDLLRIEVDEYDEYIRANY